MRKKKDLEKLQGKAANTPILEAGTIKLLYLQVKRLTFLLLLLLLIQFTPTIASI